MESGILSVSRIYRQASVKTNLPPSKGTATRTTDMDSAESGLYESNMTESVTSSSSTLIPSVPPPTPYERRNTFRIGHWEVSLFWANVFFALVVAASETGRGLSLRVWINSTAIAGNTHAHSSALSYFALSFESLSSVVIFGLGILFIRIYSPQDLGSVERNYPHFLLFLVGFCNALSEVLTTVLASEPEVQAPRHLDSILKNFAIPLTISARRVFLKKRPTLKKLICAVVVTVTPVVYVIETQTKLQSGWTVPIMAAISCLPTAMAIVLVERGVKMQQEMSRRGINLHYFLFWISTYQFLFLASALVWVDILPASGSTNTTQDTSGSNIEDFGRNWLYGLQFCFGAAEPAMIGTLVIFLYVCTYAGSVNLLRHSEGATWLVIVQVRKTHSSF